MKKSAANLCHGLTCVIFLLLAGLYFYQGYALEDHHLINAHGSYFSIIKIGLQVACGLIGLTLLSIVYVLVFEQRDFMEDRLPALPAKIFLTAFIISILLFVEMQFLGLVGVSGWVGITLLSTLFISSVLAYIFNQQLLKSKTNSKQSRSVKSTWNQPLIINPLNYRK